MAKFIVAGKPFSRNEISTLASLFETSFNFYLDGFSPSFPDHLKSLRTIVGLGFTATLADRDLLITYQHYLNHFMTQKEGNFRECQGAKTHIAQCCSEMVATALISFKALRYPNYYQDFSCAIESLISSPVVGRQEEVDLILSHLK